VNRSRMFSLNARSLVAGGIAVVIAGGCSNCLGDRTRTNGDTARVGATDTTEGPLAPIAACAISSDSVRRLTRRQFLTWASALAYEAPDPAWGQANGFAAADSIRVHIARGIDRVTRPHLEDGCVIARVYSRRPDARLGLGRGWTYIWADSSSPYSASFVPEDTSPVVGQNMTLDPSGAAPVAGVASPRHICSECGRDWCVYPRDTLGTDPVEFLPEGGIGLLGVIGGGATTLSSAALPP
jgi:hypothetical protein